MTKRRLKVPAGVAALLFAAAIGLAVPQAAAAAPGGCSYVESSHRPVLRYGNTGVGVKQAQCLSNVWNGIPKLVVDGKFGNSTLAKIKWIQGCHGLDRDGVIGPATWSALYEPVADCYDPYPG